MKKLIINADDFGLTKAVNLGIIEAHKEGILTSTTLMANMDSFDHAVSLAKMYPTLGVGVHLVLTAGRPLTKCPSLISENGDFHKLAFFESEFSVGYDEIYQEWKAQINKVITAGIVPTHLDSHHHIHTIKGISDIIVRLAKEYQLPVRNNFMMDSEIKKTDKFIMELDSLTTSNSIWEPLFFYNLETDFEKFETIELMCHPGFIDSDLIHKSGLVNNRPLVCELLKADRIKQALLNSGISLVSYRDI